MRADPYDARGGRRRRSRPWTAGPTPDSFRRVFGQRDFGRYFVSSLVVAGRVVVVSAFVAFLAATAVTRFLWQILFPLAFPGLVATSVFSFISAWNDFLFAKSFAVSDTSQSTLPMALLVFFVFVQRRLVSGLDGAERD